MSSDYAHSLHYQSPRLASSYVVAVSKDDADDRLLIVSYLGTVILLLLAAATLDSLWRAVPIPFPLLNQGPLVMPWAQSEESLNLKLSCWLEDFREVAADTVRCRRDWRGTARRNLIVGYYAECCTKLF